MKRLILLLSFVLWAVTGRADWAVLRPCGKRGDFYFSGGCYSPMWEGQQFKKQFDAYDYASDGDYLINLETGKIFRMRKSVHMNVKIEEFKDGGTR